MRLRIGQRYRRRIGWFVAGVVAVAGVAVWAAARWWPAGLRPWWIGTQQAVTVANIVGAATGVLGLALALLVYLRPRSAHPGRVAGRRGLQVVGRVPQPAAWFQPREAGKRLAQAVGKGRTTVLTQVVSGMGGVGKTQLAADHARRLAAELDLLVWITASSPDAIVTGYAQAAAVLGLAGDDGDAQQAARRFLAWAERTGRRWLVVFDDLTRPGDLAGWWPPAGRRGRVLVTTRRRDAVLQADGWVMVDVDLFTAEEAYTYLVQALPDRQRGALNRLAADLGYLPLALAQSAAYIRDRRLTCEQYRMRLADRRRKLRDLLPEAQALPDEQQATVAATWSLSIEVADELKPEGHARPVLELASLLDPNGIPAAVFATEDVLRYLATVTGRLVTHEDAADTLHNLHRLNLLAVDQDQAGVRIHNLVQRAAQESLTDRQTRHLAHAAADALRRLWPAPEPDAAAAARLRANAATLHRHAGPALLLPEAHPVLFRAGSSLGKTGQVAAAQSHFQNLLMELLAVLGPDHPDTLTARGYLARWRGEAGDAAGAATAFQELLADMVRVLGPGHSDALTARNHLAHWRGEAGKAAEAADALQELLTDRLRVHGPDHPDTLITRGNLAHWRGRAGDAAGSAEAFRELLADRLRVLGPDHPDTLTTRNHLARWRGEAGDVAGAATAFRELLADMVRVHGPDHPDIATTRNHLVYWQGKAGLG